MPSIWGEMMISKNGHSYMDYKVEVELHKAVDENNTER